MPGKWSVAEGSVLDWEDDPFEILTFPSMTANERLFSAMLLSDMFQRLSGNGTVLFVSDHPGAGGCGCSLLLPPGRDSRIPDIFERTGVLNDFAERHGAEKRLSTWLRNVLGRSAEAGVEEMARAAGTVASWRQEKGGAAWMEAPLPAGGEGFLFARSRSLWSEFERLAAAGLVRSEAVGAIRANAEGLFLSNEAASGGASKFPARAKSV